MSLFEHLPRDLPAARLRREGIAYVLDDFPLRSERFVEREVDGLRQAGVRLRLCVLRRGLMDDEAAGENAFLEVVPHRRMPLAWPAWRKEMGRLVLRAPRDTWRTLRGTPTSVTFARRLCTDPPALVHCHFAYRPTFVGRSLAALLGRPWGVSVHARDLYVGLARGTQRLTGASHLVACSERAALDVRRSLEDHPRPPRIEVVHHGLDLSHWTNTWAPARGTELAAEPHILAVGRLLPKKGFDVLVAACAALQKPRPRLRCTIAGDGPEREALRRQASRTGADVQLVAWKGEEDLRRLYASASLLVAPSRVAGDGDRDNIPNVVVEAMACGVPVVASALPALETAFAAQGAALLVKPESPGALASAIDAALSQPALAAALRANGRRLVEARFDQARNVARLIQVFEDTLAAVH